MDGLFTVKVKGVIATQRGVKVIGRWKCCSNTTLRSVPALGASTGFWVFPWFLQRGSVWFASPLWFGAGSGLGGFLLGLSGGPLGGLRRRVMNGWEFRNL